MYGPVPALASLAELGIRKVYLHLIDKDYVEWLKKAGEKPAAKESPEGGGGMPHGIDWVTVWKEWEARVKEAATPHTSKATPPDVYLDVDGDPVRQLVMSTYENGQRRLSDAAAQLQEYTRLNELAKASEDGNAIAAANEAMARLRTLLTSPILPMDDPRITLLSTEFSVSHPTSNASQLAVLAAAVEEGVGKARCTFTKAERRARPSSLLPRSTQHYCGHGYVSSR